MQYSEAREVVAKLNYLAKLPLYRKEKPYQLLFKDVPAHFPRDNIKFAAHDTTLQDMRHANVDFDLESTGFMAVQHISPCLPRFEDLAKGGADTTAAARPYLDETIALVKERLEAERVIVSHWLASVVRQHCSRHGHPNCLAW